MLLHNKLEKEAKVAKEMRLHEEMFLHFESFLGLVVVPPRN